jgi:hypothetical protein
MVLKEKNPNPDSSYLQEDPFGITMLKPNKKGQVNTDERS